MKGLKIGLVPTCLSVYYDVWPDLKGKLESIVENEIIKRVKKYGEIIYPCFVDSLDSAKEAEEEFIKKGVDVVLIIELSYTNSEIPFTAIKNLQKPIIVLSTQLLEKVGPDFSFKELLSGNCLVGTEELICALKRVGADYHLVSGLMQKDSTYEKLGSYFKAIEIIKKLRDLNVGLIGSTPYPGMMDFAVDETFINKKFGSRITHISVNDVIKIHKSVKQEEINKLINEVSGKYKKINLSSEQFDMTAKMTICFEKIIEEYGIKSIALYCQPLMYNPELGICPCFAATFLNTKGIPVSAEGDVAGAISMYVMNELTGNTVCAEHYILDYERNAILMAHEGNGNLNFARSNNDVILRPHSMWVGACGIGGVTEFSAKEGNATMLNMSPDADSNWKMVIATGRNIYEPPIKGLGIPQSWFEIKMDLDEFIKRWCSAGPSHHIAVSYGEVEETLVKIGSMLDLNVSVIK
ncbi:MAG: L-arabinose isomerase family protein [Candidatus Humimicrobiaceae bacterium]